MGMSNLTSRPLSVDELQQILHEFNQPVVNYNKIGTITHESRWNRYIGGLLTHNNQPRLTELIEKVQYQFQELETHAVKFYDMNRPELAGEVQAYRDHFKPYLKFVEAVRAQINLLPTVSPELKSAYADLQRMEMSLSYRIGSINGGLDPTAEPDPMCLEKLIRYATEWKQKQYLARNLEINPLEMEQLRQAACYPEWNSLLENTEYRKEFMGWAIQQWLPVNSFIEFDSGRKWIKDSLLSSALGNSRTADDQILRVEKVATKTAGVSKKILSLPIYHGDFKRFEPEKQARFSLLNPNKEIHFLKGNYRATLREILKQWALKNEKEVNFSFCQWGMINFHPVHGPWNAETQSYEAPPYRDWERENWLDKVPPIRTVSHAELERQYGPERMNGRNFFFKAMAARKFRDLTALDCHGYWELYSRMEDGQWKVSGPGPYAFRFQDGILDGLSLFCHTVKRVLSLIDQNNYYTHRERGGLAVFPTAEQGADLVSRIYDIMVGQGVFQFSARNCSYYVQKAINAAVPGSPNFYRMDISGCRTGVPPLDKLLAWSHKRCEWIRNLILTFIHTVLWSHRGMAIREMSGAEEVEVNYSVREFFGNEGFVIYNPSYLIRQIEEGKRTGNGPFANGEIFWTHTDQRLLDPLPPPSA
ncbi:MAG: hypothetical protein H0V82_02690 [Candidatus Protochlamydia sp.]|nr:hypothetical protein [Candidatus Protochlamydia sp.]